MITETYLETIIEKEEYVILGKKTTVCHLTVANGFEVIGQSAPVKAEMFDEELGRKYARQDAINKLWAFEGYLLQQRLFEK
jgi:hypothetical protein